MNVSLKAAVAAAIGLSPAAALAVTIDFTAAAIPDGVTVTAAGGPLTLTAFDGAAPVPGLASISDGLGVGDDEISVGQSITVDFGELVTITGLYFLDLFVGPQTSDAETAVAEFSDGTILSFTAAETRVAGAAGFLFAALAAPISASSVIFTAGPGNDDSGVPDFALAGIDLSVVEVPLPASGMLLLAGLAGVGYVARRRQKA
jgi:hypothetical protein